MKPIPLPSPVELGLPAKFRDWYPDQIQAIDKIVMADRRFIALAMPTGSGKSVTGIATSMLHPNVKRAVYLTSTKALQDQLATDFESIGLADLRGRDNYQCRDCDRGICHPGMLRMNGEPQCPYYAAVWRARQASLVSTNYAMYFATNTYSQGLGQIDLLLLDEAHDADKELEGFLGVELTLDELELIGERFRGSRTLAGWSNWAAKCAPRLKRRLEDEKNLYGKKRLRNLLVKLERLSKIDVSKWAMEEEQYLVRFSPVQVGPYAEQYLFQNVKHVVLMSATLTHKTLADLGVARDQYSFWEAPSRFPIEHRPIISIETTPSVRVDARMTEDDKLFWMRRVDRIIDSRRRLGWKGIIHTVSYYRMKELIERSEHKDIMIAHDSKTTSDAIRYFKESNGPLILVSPSIVTGYDFPDDDCRYQIIAKVPLPDMRGPIMKARGELDKEYSGYLAMQKLVQACGRSTRGPNDWSEVFIVDDHFSDWFLRVNKKHAPKWFRDAIERVEYFPDPLVIAA